MAPTDYHLNEQLLLSGQHIQLRTTLPLGCGIQNLYEAHGVGYAIDVIAAESTNLHKILEQFCVDEDEPLRIKGADHRAMLERIFSAHLKPAV